jgi:hypothetical protein
MCITENVIKDVQVANIVLILCHPDSPFLLDHVTADKSRATLWRRLQPIRPCCKYLEGGVTATN